MDRLYIDTSPLGRVLLGERDAAAIRSALEGSESRVASRLTPLELRRVAFREGVTHRIDALLEGIAFVPLDEHVIVIAETIEPATVATLDAIHLATAVRVRADAMMTYDRRLAAAARAHGLQVLAPT